MPWYIRTMEQPTAAEIKAEAREYLAWYDSAGDDTYHPREAGAMADFILESKFAQVDADCDWPEDFCTFFFETAMEALVEAGLPR